MRAKSDARHLGLVALLSGCTAITDIDTTVLTGGAASNQEAVLPEPSFACCEAADEDAFSLNDEINLSEPFVDAGFVELKPVNYTLFHGLNGRWEKRQSDAAKLFYSLVPADRDPKHAPLFLFFNGGPASATMHSLRAHGTGPMQVNLETGEVERNPHSWSQLGNLLYVDARQVGFSYSEVPATFTDSSFNPFVDAADFARVLLAVYATHPALADNPVVVVAESYGGLRAQHLLNLLRNPFDLTSGVDGKYIDHDLAVEVGEHQRTTNIRRQSAGLSAWNAGEQFGWQILIEPSLVLSMPYRRLELEHLGPEVEPNASSLYANKTRLRELGIAWPGLGGAFQANLTLAQEADQTTKTLAALLSPSGFEHLIGVRPESIAGMGADARNGAARHSDCGCSYREGAAETCGRPQPAWTDTLGDLGPCDNYFTLHSSDAGRRIEALAIANRWLPGALFLKNLRGVHTFITRALLDATIVSDAIPPILGHFIPSRDERNPYAVSGSSVALAAVELDLSTEQGLARPGHIDVTYLPESKGASAPTRRIRFPTYENAGHTVAASSPRELFDDVRAFLCTSAAPSSQ